MIAVGFEKYGSQEALEKDAIKHLFDVYVKINAEAEKDPEIKVEAAKFFKRMEDGDESALVNWRVWRELSVKKYAEEYDRLNVHFDHYVGESLVGKEWQDKALEKLTEMNLIDDHEGAKLVNLEQWKMGKAVLRKKGKHSRVLNALDVVLIRSRRRHFHLPHTRYRRRYRAVREVQVRQDDLRRCLPARSASGPIFQGLTTHGFRLGRPSRARQLWSRTRDEHSERHGCLLRSDHQGGRVCDARADEEERREIQVGREPGGGLARDRYHGCQNPGHGSETVRSVPIAISLHADSRLQNQ